MFLYYFLFFCLVGKPRHYFYHRAHFFASMLGHYFPRCFSISPPQFILGQLSVLFL
jgi:hypothetical protein